MESLNTFFIQLNNDNHGIVLQNEANEKEIHFFNLKIRAHNNQLITSTFFKETDRNGFISTDICHHKSWLKAVPKSQFTRLKRNCTFRENYLEEAPLLKACFVKKGYDPVDLDRVIQDVDGRDRSIMLKPWTESMHPDCPSQQASHLSPAFSFFTAYSTQHYVVKDLIRKYWSVLKSDKVLGSRLPEVPVVTFSGVPPLRLQVASNIVEPPKKQTFFF